MIYLSLSSSVFTSLVSSPTKHLTAKQLAWQFAISCFQYFPVGADNYDLVDVFFRCASRWSGGSPRVWKYWHCSEWRRLYFHLVHSALSLAASTPKVFMKPQYLQNWQLDALVICLEQKSVDTTAMGTGWKQPGNSSSSQLRKGSSLKSGLVTSSINCAGVTDIYYGFLFWLNHLIMFTHACSKAALVPSISHDGHFREQSNTALSWQTQHLTKISKFTFLNFW